MAVGRYQDHLGNWWVNDAGSSRTCRIARTDSFTMTATWDCGYTVPLNPYDWNTPNGILLGWYPCPHARREKPEREGERPRGKPVFYVPPSAHAAEKECLEGACRLPPTHAGPHECWCGSRSSHKVCRELHAEGRTPPYTP